MRKWIIKNMCMLSAVWIFGLIGVVVLNGLTIEDGVRPTAIQRSIFFFCLGGMLLEILLCLCSRWLPKWYACDGMGWHKAPQSIGFDGCSNNGVCPRCNRSVMQDSQGNWF